MIEHDPIVRLSRENLGRMGIEAVLFDLDDTLIYTSEIFRYWMNQYATEVVRVMGVSAKGGFAALGDEKLRERLRVINDEEYLVSGVNPMRWREVVARLGDEYGGHRALVESLPILMKIYTTVPRRREGAKQLLELGRGIGIKQGLVTHANVEWTYWKIQKLGWWNYFDSVTIADENKHKNIEDWRRAMTALGVDPEHCLVVGDSLKGDVQAGSKLGAKTVWLPSPWSMFREGEVPIETMEIGEIKQLLSIYAGIEVK